MAIYHLVPPDPTPEEEAWEYAHSQATYLMYTILSLRDRKISKKDVNPDILDRIRSALHDLFLEGNVTAKMYTQPEKLATALVDLTWR